MNYHIHILKIESEAEIDMEADSSEEARDKALEMTSEMEFGQPSCNYLALEPLG